MKAEVLQVQFVRFDSSHSEGPEQAAGSTSTAGWHTGVRCKASGFRWRLSGCRLIINRGFVSRVVSGLCSLVFHRSYDVLVGRQVRGALPKVTLTHGVLTAADHFLIGWHVVRSWVAGKRQKF